MLRVIDEGTEVGLKDAIVIRRTARGADGTDDAVCEIDVQTSIAFERIQQGLTGMKFDKVNSLEDVPYLNYSRFIQQDPFAIYQSKHVLEEKGHPKVWVDILPFNQHLGCGFDKYAALGQTDPQIW